MRKMYLKSAILAATLIFSLGAAPADSAKTEKTIGVSTVYAAEASQPESEEGDPVKRNTFENSDSYDSAPLYGDWKSDSADLSGTIYTVSGIKNIDKPSKNQIITRYSSVKNNVITKVYQTSPSAKNPYSIGRLDSTFVNSGLTFLNFYRYVGGLGTVSLDQNLMYGNSGAQYGAVLLAASKNADSNFRLSHYPPRPADMSTDFYNNGSGATSTSNISMRSGYNSLYSFQQSIYGCMNENNSTQNLTTMGHRRWFLNPPLGKVGFGYAESDSGHSYMVTKIFDTSASVGDYDFIAWPASGNFPNDIFDTKTPWSISLNPSKFNVSYNVLNNAVIRVRRDYDGKTWTITNSNDKTSPTGSDMIGAYFHVNTEGYGLNNCIIFNIGSNLLGASAYSGKYTVTVTGLKDKYNNPATLNYTVDFFSMGEDISKISDPSYDNIKGTSIYNGVDYSKVYDYTYYLLKYPDLLKAFNGNAEAAIKHFVNYGMKEGRQAKANFDVKSYKNQYSDLRAAFGNDLTKYYLHYINYGYKEGRIATGVPYIQNPITKLNGVDYSRVYDFNYYISKYADIKKAFGNDDVAALKHFVNYGMKEGRQAKANFNVNSYKLGYRDLRAAFGNDLTKYYIHYINNGYKENRKTTGITEIQNGITVYNGIDYSRVYDYSYYVKNNPDVKRAFGNDDIAVLKHFINYGMKEGRQAKATFKLQAYKARYADLRKAYGNDNKSYYMHYIKYGYNEKRKAN